MKAKLLFHEKLITEEGDIEERVIWAVQEGVLFPEGVRYRLAFIPRATLGPVVLYDNHHPKCCDRLISSILAGRFCGATRSEEGAYREYATEERRSSPRKSARPFLNGSPRFSEAK